MNNTDNGGYDLEGVIWHQHSNKLMKAMLELWPEKDKAIIDIGCGHNFYASVFRYAGYFADGVDSVQLKGVDYCRDITKNLAQEIPWHKYSRVISLEVGEHIPDNLADAYLGNITSFGDDIIMSWAVPGQAGVGHINCRPYEWVTSKMFDRGFIIDADRTAFLRNAVSGCHCSWFQNTLMYFRRDKK